MHTEIVVEEEIQGFSWDMISSLLLWLQFHSSPVTTLKKYTFPIFTRTSGTVPNQLLLNSLKIVSKTPNGKKPGKKKGKRGYKVRESCTGKYKISTFGYFLYRNPVGQNRPNFWQSPFFNVWTVRVDYVRRRFSTEWKSKTGKKPTGRFRGVYQQKIFL